MRHIEINIGKACNSRCRFCMSSRPTADEIRLTPFEDIKKDLEQHRKSGCDSVGFLGGDISIHPRMVDIFRTARSLGYENVQMVTNALIFADPKKAEEVVQAGVTRVNISVHSHQPAIEDYLTQIPGGLVRKLKGIRAFSELQRKGLLRSAVSINIVLNRHNYSDIVKTCWFFFSKMGIVDMRMNFVWPEFSLGEHAWNIALRYSEFIPQFRELISLAIKHRIRLTFDTIPPCVFREAFPKEFKKLLPLFLGEQYDQIDAISVIGMDDNFSWKNRKRNQFKYQASFCKDCQFFHSCDGLWREHVEMFGMEKLQPILRNDGDVTIDRLCLGKENTV